MKYSEYIPVLIFTSLTTASVIRYKEEREEESDIDFGGKLTEVDFFNAENPLFYREPNGGELNEDVDDLFEGDIIIDEFEFKPWNNANMLDERKWPKINGHVIVPYTIPSTATKQDTADVARVIIEFHNKTCVRFQPRQAEDDWVHINTQKRGCKSKIGRQTGKQVIRAKGCLDPKIGGSYGKLLHECMHALGFWHEHSRRDRDTFITIHSNEIERVVVDEYAGSDFIRNKFKKNFEMCSNCTSHGPYDYDSVMHYPAKLGTIQERTVITINDERCNIGFLGQRFGLSLQDIIDIQNFYECDKTSCNGKECSRWNFQTRLIHDRYGGQKAGDIHGEWYTKELCPVNTYAYAFSIKVEPYQGWGLLSDDSGLNAVRLYCKFPSKNAQIGSITSGQGSDGSWTNDKSCSGENLPLVGFQFKSSTKAPSGDDRFGQNINVKCSNGEILKGEDFKLPKKEKFDSSGKWSSWENCPANSAICGIKTKIHPKRGRLHDDVGLTDIELVCCNLLSSCKI